MSRKQRIMKDFDKGLRPSQIKRRGLKNTTIYRYFQEWKVRKRVTEQKRPSLDELIAKIRGFVK